MAVATETSLKYVMESPSESARKTAAAVAVTSSCPC